MDRIRSSMAGTFETLRGSFGFRNSTNSNNHVSSSAIAIPGSPSDTVPQQISHLALNDVIDTYVPESDDVDPSYYSPMDALLSRVYCRTVRQNGLQDEHTSEIVQSIEIPDPAELPFEGWRPFNQDISITDVTSKYQESIAKAKEMAELGWAKDTMLAYLKAERCGYEPVLHPSWRKDLHLFPQILFARPKDPVLITTYDGKDIGSDRFYHLCKMMVYSRDYNNEDKIIEQNHRTMRMTGWIKQYLRTVIRRNNLIKDIKYGRVPALLLLKGPLGRPKWKGDGQEVEMLQREVVSELAELGEHLLRRLRFATPEGSRGNRYLIPPPSIFAILPVNNIITIVAWEPVERICRTIAMLDLSDHEITVERVLQMVIVIHWAFHSMCRVREALEEQQSMSDYDTDDMDVDSVDSDEVEDEDSHMLFEQEPPLSLKDDTRRSPDIVLADPYLGPIYSIASKSTQV